MAGSTKGVGDFMKTAIYKLTGSNDRIVEYDENAPCDICGLPVSFTSGRCNWTSLY